MLLERTRTGEPVTERVANQVVPLQDAPRACAMFEHVRDDCARPVLRP